MNKRELVEKIMELNRSARREFLEAFSERELSEYLNQLSGIDLSSMWSGHSEGAVATV